MSRPRFDRLLAALRVLPGVGPKSAQRMALHLLQRNRAGGRALATALQQAMDGIQQCERCRDLAEQAVCSICADPRREERQLCVVEGPSDVLALEHAGGFRGRYFVLHGHLSPIDGIGPEQIGLDRLLERLQALHTLADPELIVATNATVEGEATAHYIATMAGDLGIVCSRIAHGIPLGGELEQVDTGTLARAMRARTRL